MISVRAQAGLFLRVQQHFHDLRACIIVGKHADRISRVPRMQGAAQEVPLFRHQIAAVLCLFFVKPFLARNGHFIAVQVRFPDHMPVFIVGIRLSAESVAPGNGRAVHAVPHFPDHLFPLVKDPADLCEPILGKNRLVLRVQIPLQTHISVFVVFLLNSHIGVPRRHRHVLRIPPALPDDLLLGIVYPQQTRISGGIHHRRAFRVIVADVHGISRFIQLLGKGRVARLHRNRRALFIKVGFRAQPALGLILALYGCVSPAAEHRLIFQIKVPLGTHIGIFVIVPLNAGKRVLQHFRRVLFIEPGFRSDLLLLIKIPA